MTEKKNIIQQLNSIDIKNVDISAWVEELWQRKDLLVNIGIVVIACIFALHLVGSRNSEVKNYKKSIRELEKKVAILEDLELLKTQTTKYLKTVPDGPKDISELMSIVTEIAVKDNVQISSVVPGQEETTPYYTKFNLDLVVTADQYQNIARFIYDLESVQKNIRIDSWASGSSAQGGRRLRWQKTESSSENRKTKVVLKISSIQLKKGKK